MASSVYLLYDFLKFKEPSSSVQVSFFIFIVKSLAYFNKCTAKSQVFFHSWAVFIIFSHKHLAGSSTSIAQQEIDLSTDH